MKAALLPDRGVVKVVGDDSDWIELTAAQVSALTEENRAKAVAHFYRSKCTVLQNVGSVGYAFLFEPQGDAEQSFATVRQLIGDPDSPSFVIDHKMRRPGKERRENYDTRTRRTFTMRKGDMPRRRVIVDLRPGIELRLQGGEQNHARRSGGESFQELP